MTDMDTQLDDTPSGDDGKQPCPHCLRSYRVPYLYHHMRSVHGIYGGQTGTKRRQPKQKLLSCEECGRGFETKHGLTMHVTLAHRRQERLAAEPSTALVPVVNNNNHREPTFKLSKEWRIVEDEDGTPFLLLSLSDLVADRMTH
jgi:hypothetical protein